MEDDLDAVEGRRERLRIEEVAGKDLEAARKKRQAIDVRAVEHSHAMALARERFRQMRADESGAPQHQRRSHAEEYPGLRPMPMSRGWLGASGGTTFIARK